MPKDIQNTILSYPFIYIGASDVNRDSLKASQETSRFPVGTCGVEADSRSLEVSNSAISACVYFSPSGCLSLCLSLHLYLCLQCASLSPLLERQSPILPPTSFPPSVFSPLPQSSLQGLWVCCFPFNSTSITSAPHHHLQSSISLISKPWGGVWPFAFTVSFRFHSPIIDLPAG